MKNVISIDNLDRLNTQNRLFDKYSNTCRNNRKTANEKEYFSNYNSVI